jgi:hypothetical protein
MANCSLGAPQTANSSVTNSALMSPKKFAFGGTAVRIARPTSGIFFLVRKDHDRWPAGDLTLSGRSITSRAIESAQTKRPPSAGGLKSGRNNAKEER